MAYAPIAVCFDPRGTQTLMATGTGVDAFVLDG